MERQSFMEKENKLLIRRWPDEVLTLGHLRRVDDFSPSNYAFFSLAWVSKAKPRPVHLTVARLSFSKASA
jgi:hypothetical protein